jgi:hypothetical protein
MVLLLGGTVAQTPQLALLRQLKGPRVILRLVRTLNSAGEVRAVDLRG